MSTQTWGLMPKSQEDAETIEEAVERIVAEHEANPEAHTGENESLQAHRANEIVDHKAGCIVPDKLSFTEREITTFFESLDYWAKQGNVSGGLGDCGLTVFGDDVEDTFSVQTSLNFRSDDDFLPYDNYFQTALKFNNFYDIADVFFGLGIDEDGGIADYFLGFKIEGTECFVGYGLGVSVTWESVGSIADNIYHTFRVDTQRETLSARFFIDGVEVKSVDMSEPDDWNYSSFGYKLEKTGGTTNGQAKGIQINYLTFYSPIIAPIESSSPPPESSSPPPESSSPPPESSSPPPESSSPPPESSSPPPESSSPPPSSNTKSLQLVRASSQDVYISNNLGIGTGAVTLELWFKPSTDPTGQYFWLFDLISNTSDVEYSLRYSDLIDSPNYTLSAERVQKSVDGAAANYNIQLDTDTWYHLALVFTGSHLQLWLATEGGGHTKVAETTASGAGTGTNPDAFYIGSLRHLGNYADGVFDDVRVWNVARSESQLNDNFEIELEGTETNLVAYYKFSDDLTDETSNSYDLSGNASPAYSEDLPF